MQHHAREQSEREIEAEGLKQSLEVSCRSSTDQGLELLAATSRMELLTGKVSEMESHREALDRMEQGMHLLQLQLQMTEGSRHADLEHECDTLRGTLKQRDRELATAMALADAAWSSRPRAVPVATGKVAASLTSPRHAHHEGRLDGTMASIFGQGETQRVVLATASALLEPP